MTMPSNRETLLCQYRYDPLDRLVVSTPSAQSDAQRFYLKDRLATEIQGAMQCSIMQHDDQLLAQQQRQNGTAQTRLLATDQQRSVLNVLDATHPHPLAYSPYGHRPAQSGLLSLLGFNGERPDPVTGCYLLGNGYRAFNPVLMRFNSPDSWSPFGKGGLNAYVYCLGDPVNRSDPTGHSWIALISYVSKQLNRISNAIDTGGKMPILMTAASDGSAATKVKHNWPGFAQRINTPISPLRINTPISPFEKLPQEIFEKVTREISGSDMAKLSSTSKTMNSKVTAASNSRYQQMLRKNQSTSDPQQFQYLITKGLIDGIAPSQIRNTDFTLTSLHEALPPLFENRLRGKKVILPSF
jgi:RHS repeat-associated protein